MKFMCYLLCCVHLLCCVRLCLSPSAQSLPVVPSVQQPCALCPRMPSKKLCAVGKKILAHIEKQHAGSGDVELEDAIDPIEYLTQRFMSAPADFAAIIAGLQTRLEHLDGAWTGRRHAPETHMPLTPAPGVTVDMWLSVAHLGFTVETSVKGKSKAIRIMDCVEDFLAEPYDSLRSPLSVLAPWGGVQRPVEIFSVRHRIGFARSLTSQLILLAVHDMKLRDAELESIQHLLTSHVALRLLCMSCMATTAALLNRLCVQRPVSCVRWSAKLSGWIWTRLCAWRSPTRRSRSG